MRTTSRMPPCWLKVWLSKLLFLIRAFQNGTLPRIGTSFYLTLMKLTKKWWGNFTVTPSYLSIILNINRLVFQKPPVYNDLDLQVDLLLKNFRENLEFFTNGKLVSVSSLFPKLRLLKKILYHNVYPLSSTKYMNLGWALFLHDLTTDEEIVICSHIFHILSKTAERIALRNCLPFCCLI